MFMVSMYYITLKYDTFRLCHDNINMIELEHWVIISSDNDFVSANGISNPKCLHLKNNQLYLLMF